MPLISVLGISGGSAVADFTPQSLFEGGENGLFYDIQDGGSLWGATAAKAAGGWDPSVGTVIQLIVDKKVTTGTMADFFSGAAEVTTNGDMNTDASWTKGTGTTHDGSTGFDLDGTAEVALSQAVCENGEEYWVTVVVSAHTSGSAAARLGGSDTNVLTHINGVGSFEFAYRASGSTLFSIYSTDFIGTIDSVSIKQFPEGNHSFGGTSPLPPQLENDGTYNYLECRSNQGIGSDNVTTIMSADSVVMCGFKAYNDANFAKVWQWRLSTQAISLANGAASSGVDFEPSVWDWVTEEWAEGSSNETLNIIEVHIDDTNDVISVRQDDSEVLTDAAVAGGYNATAGRMYLARDTGGASGNDCDIYGMLVYEGDFNQDAYDYFADTIGL